MAKLMNDKKLYDNIEASTKNLNLLLQDLRLNPKRYAHFFCFRQKTKKSLRFLKMILPQRKINRRHLL
jgi:phospholipid/cholesterol/gamma-HCH transport system substrate-binding protein